MSIAWFWLYWIHEKDNRMPTQDPSGTVKARELVLEPLLHFFWSSIGISVLISRPTGTIHLTASAYNALYSFT